MNLYDYYKKTGIVSLNPSKTTLTTPETKLSISPDIKLPSIEEEKKGFFGKVGGFFSGLGKPKTPSGIPAEPVITKEKATIRQEMPRWYDLVTYFGPPGTSFPLFGSPGRIIESPTVGDVRMHDPKYTAARVGSGVEKMVFGIWSLGNRAGAKVADTLGAKGLADDLRFAAKTLEQGEFGMFTTYAKGEQQRRAVAYSEAGLGLSIMNTVVENGIDLGILIGTIKSTFGAGAGPSLTAYTTKAGKLIAWAKHSAKLATFRFLTTPSESMQERAANAAWMVAYNSTPYAAVGIVGKVPWLRPLIPGGSLGMKAFFVDVALNTTLSSKAYHDIAKEYGWWSEEFLSLAIPNFMMDVGMAWGTRNLPVESRDPGVRAVANQAAAKHQATYGGDIKEHQKTYYDLYKELNYDLDNYRDMGSLVHLTAKYGEITGRDPKISLDSKGNLTKETTDMFNAAFGTRIQPGTPESFLTGATFQGIKFNETNPALRGAREISAEHAKTSPERIETNQRIVLRAMENHVNNVNQRFGLDIIPRTEAVKGVEPVRVDTRPAKEITEEFFHSKHWERIKETYGETEGVVMAKKQWKTELEKAVEKLNSPSPDVRQEAMRIAYGLEKSSSELSDIALRRAAIESLKSAGQTERAKEIERVSSQEISRSAQELALAKVDLPGSGHIKAEATILRSQLESIGKKMVEAFKGEAPAKRAQRKITTEAKKAAGEVTKEQAKIQAAQKLLDLLAC